MICIMQSYEWQHLLCRRRFCLHFIDFSNLNLKLSWCISMIVIHTSPKFGLKILSIWQNMTLCFASLRLTAKYHFINFGRIKELKHQTWYLSHSLCNEDKYEILCFNFIYRLRKWHIKQVKCIMKIHFSSYLIHDIMTAQFSQELF